VEHKFYAIQKANQLVLELAHQASHACLQTKSDLEVIPVTRSKCQASPPHSLERVTLEFEPQRLVPHVQVCHEAVIGLPGLSVSRLTCPTNSPIWSPSLQVDMSDQFTSHRLTSSPHPRGSLLITKSETRLRLRVHLACHRGVSPCPAALS